MWKGRLIAKYLVQVKATENSLKGMHLVQTLQSIKRIISWRITVPLVASFGLIIYLSLRLKATRYTVLHRCVHLPVNVYVYIPNITWTSPAQENIRQVPGPRLGFSITENVRESFLGSQAREG